MFLTSPHYVAQTDRYSMSKPKQHNQEQQKQQQYQGKNKQNQIFQNFNNQTEIKISIHE